MRFIDLAGQTFGRLTVIERAPNRRNLTFWQCVCVCGTTCEVNSARLRSGETKSCGCLSKEMTIARSTKHGHHSFVAGSTYNTWNSMKQRCLNKNYREYKYWGGRGIQIHPAWINDFSAFLADVGERPLGHTLDRIDVNGHYEPGNVRWATPQEQRVNQR